MITNEDLNGNNFQELEKLPDNQQELFAEFERRRRVILILN